jgi:SPP1 gp7 family putative phage head morphogenesis protein
MCLKCESLEQDYELEEWLNFNYKQFLSFIKAFIKIDRFELLRATNQLELDLGKLSDIQIANLKDNLIEAYDNGYSIRKLAKVIEESGLPSLKRISGDKIVEWIPSNTRSIIIAQTESVRVANEGSRNYYKNSGIKEYSWIANGDDLTCPVCMSLNGKIVKINSSIIPPAHVRCRCNINPITNLDIEET